MLRKVNREGVVLLGGGRAILLQLAHPFVAAGVDDHSNFQSEILHRLYRTVQFLHTLAFEDRHRGQKALKGFHQMHSRIKGRLGPRAGSFPQDTTYSGTNPHAKLWVYATFVDTGLKAYETFIRPLTPEELGSYHSDSLVLARLLEIPEEIVPQTPDQFRAYMNEMLTGNTLAVTETAQRLARAVLYPGKVGFLPGISAAMLRLATAGLLEDRFRTAYGLTWNGQQRRLMNGLKGSIRLLRPVAPPQVWKSPLQGGRVTHFLLWGPGSARI